MGDNEIKLAIQREEGVYVKALINELQNHEPGLKNNRTDRINNTGIQEHRHIRKQRGTD
jgi:hypothetical protein